MEGLEKMSNRKYRNVAFSAIITLIILLLAIAIYLFFLPNYTKSFWGINTCITCEFFTSRSEYLTVISLHYTIVFLTTGLMSMLGAKEDYVYYVDIVKRQLLEPIGLNFKDLSWYSFLSIFISTIGFLVNSSFVVLYAASLGTTGVAIIFFKMIDIYFGREKWKIKVFNEIQAAQELKFQEHLREMDIIIKKNVYTLAVNADITSIADNLSFLFVLLVENEADEDKQKYIKTIIRNAMELIKKNKDISQSEFFLYIIDASKSICKLFFSKEKKSKSKNEKVQLHISLYFMELFLRSSENFFLDDSIRDEMKALYGIDEYNGLKTELDKQKEVVRLLCEKKEKSETVIDGKSKSLIECEKLLKLHLLSRYPKAFLDNDAVYDEIKQLFELQRFNGELDLDISSPVVEEEDYPDVELSANSMKELWLNQFEGRREVVPITITAEKSEEYKKDEACSGRICFFIPEILFSIVGEERGVVILEELLTKEEHYPEEDYYYISFEEAIYIYGGCADWIARHSSVVVAEWLAKQYFESRYESDLDRYSADKNVDYRMTAFRYVCIHWMLYADSQRRFAADGMIRFWETIIRICNENSKMDFNNKYMKIFIDELENLTPSYYEEKVFTYLYEILGPFLPDDGESTDSGEPEDFDDLPFK